MAQSLAYYFNCPTHLGQPVSCHICCLVQLSRSISYYSISWSVGSIAFLFVLVVSVASHNVNCLFQLVQSRSYHFDSLVQLTQSAAYVAFDAFLMDHLAVLCSPRELFLATMESASERAQSCSAELLRVFVRLVGTALKQMERCVRFKKRLNFYRIIYVLM